jgi:formate/nitrite transporter FocA (FNT family)
MSNPTYGGHTPPGTAVPNLRGEEHEEVKDRAAPRPVVVYEAIRREGEDELLRTWHGLAWSGLAAGLSMGFSLVGQGLIAAHLPDTAWRPLLVNLGYSLGFLIVILGRQQLFTENTLTPVLPLLNRWNTPTLARVARLWAVVLATNLVGTFAFAWVVGHTTIFDDATRTAFTAIGRHAMEGSFGTIMLRGVFAGWLIALMVWLLPGAETARPIIILVITYFVGLGGFTHIVAGSVEGFYVLLTGAASWQATIGGFLLPAVIGNILGGLALVTALNHAQVTAGGGEEPHQPQANGRHPTPSTHGVTRRESP